VRNSLTINDRGPSKTRISRSSEFSVVNSTEIALNTTQSEYFMNRETTDDVYARNTESR